jgi:hypothetical protein
MQTVTKADALEVAAVDDRELNEEELDSVAGGFSVSDAMASIKLMGEILSNVSKTRSEISMTFARNARA